MERISNIIDMPVEPTCRIQFSNGPDQFTVMLQGGGLALLERAPGNGLVLDLNPESLTINRKSDDGIESCCTIVDIRIETFCNNTFLTGYQQDTWTPFIVCLDQIKMLYHGGNVRREKRWICYIK